MCLNPGDILRNRYKIIDQIGKGGFGKTYTARDIRQQGDPMLVVKEIIAPLSSDPRILQEIKKRFIREGKTLSILGKNPQIPELFDYFADEGNFFLIQEYIEGHDLSEEIGPGSLPLSEAEVIKFLQDVLEVLVFVHQHHIIHRDIKPSNLRRRKQDGKIFLIDFGAVKELNSMTITPSETGNNFTQTIGTPGYMAAEQQSGKPQLNSDLYALGMIGIQALTGLHPRTLPTDPHTGDVIWRYSSPEHPMIEVNPDLERILNKMVRYMFKDRYYSAVEALEDLRSLSVTGKSLKKRPKQSIYPPKDQKFPPQVWIGVGSALVIFGVWAVSQVIPKTCPLTLGDDLSCGEEILTRAIALPEKQEGVKAYRQRRYQEGVLWLEKARQKDPNDPETLIYLNNAQLEAQKIPFYTIAVAIPLGNPSDGGDSGKEILRGVAQLQTEINRDRTIKGHGLRVVIADDYNDLDRAKQIAGKIGSQGGILGVIGHYTSDNTRAALPTYDLHNLVVISPTSTAQTLAQDNSRFFRTIPQDNLNAEGLARYLAQTARQQKVVVFYNPNSAYSRSLYERFLISFDEQGGQVVKQFDLSKPIFDASAAIRQGENRGGTSFVLFPDAKSNPYAFSNALKVIRANQEKYLIVGGDSLYTTDILQERGSAKDIIISIPWHYLASSNQAFMAEGKKLWGGMISSRTAMAYDATKVFTTALENQSSLDFRQQIQAIFDPKIRRELIFRTVKSPHFKAEGATGKITFELSGDRHESVIQLVKVVPTKCSPYGYMYIPIQYKSAAEAGLNCN
ncbi:bifunctional serine/threonine-protein kinase/ABC transporter substrate-binding protein [Crocosphaera sp. XPORK-15E]|uniref:bifunctional serine/threonine-protein kinase/ABC transporter substrate-binding protein n=1 Tax=Crocosphaera sp. XPORK-15E TaxID=3110247 RepID=UPI002B211A1F|nr:bifunctional serine/threonine-protein kinase/ABC transporter substrate-binding protein [Crocosphaera sp. XPORK-15E]MEA5535011.1 bifunctional serine/threonine-protein kinase/ABC transporter substrate-binding protein [Crocosphaera sp. XPORK-15E]